MSFGFEELIVYKKAYKLGMEVFELSKKFPPEERYSLTDQVRRSSRSICVCIGEGYRKRIYPKHFVTKMSDADGECTETIIWLHFARDSKYIPVSEVEDIISGYREVGRMLGSMCENPEKFVPKKKQYNDN
ncbi:MAG: four helix bundle protein [Bacteroidota bacterium]